MLGPTKMVKNNFAMMTQYFNPYSTIMITNMHKVDSSKSLYNGLVQMEIVGAKTGFTFLALIFVTRMRLKPQEI